MVHNSMSHFELDPLDAFVSMGFATYMGKCASENEVIQNASQQMFKITPFVRFKFDMVGCGDIGLDCGVWVDGVRGGVVGCGGGFLWG